MVSLGIDIGGMSMKCGFVDDNGKILSKFVVKIDKSKNQLEMIEALISDIKKAMIEQNYSSSDLRGIGIGCPGSINVSTGTCDFSGNLGWRDLPIVKLIEEGIGEVKARLINDANAAAVGEAMFGAGNGKKDVLLLTLGTGVGGGVITGGLLLEGNMGKGAELGHNLLVMNGRQCTCGRKGCMEAYCSATALMNDTKEAMKAHKESSMWTRCEGSIDNVDGKTAFEEAKKGDKAAIEVRDNYVMYLGEGIINFINIFRPTVIILGGGVSNQREGLLEPLSKYLEAHGWGFGGTACPKPELVVSCLGNDAGIIGAAAMFMERK
ncbi:MAG: ROK family protein [Bacilli bacterium]|nr:ROK family protein [Bacilli bacterium]